MAGAGAASDGGGAKTETGAPQPIYAGVRTVQQSGHETGEGGGRSRRSLASVGGDLAHFEDTAGDKFQHPPNITPVGGVPNLKGKVVIRPIAFRPSPGRPGSSTGPGAAQSGSRPPSTSGSRPGGSTAPSPGLSSGYRTPVQTTFGPGGSVVTSPGHSAGPPPAPSSRPPSQGFLPGHPLVKDGHRPFGSSQELNRSQVPPPISSKFNSLDRRALGQRSCRGLGLGAQQPGAAAGGGNMSSHVPSNGLRLSTWSGYDAGSSTSLPPVGLTPASAVTSPHAAAAEARTGPGSVGGREQGGGGARPSKEPERRHSLYDSASRGRTNSVTAARDNSSSNNSSGGDKGGISAMNVNGLPEPFGPPLSRPPSTSELGPAQLTGLPRTRHSGAGTPQFRSLAGVAGLHGRQHGSSVRGSLSSLNTQGTGGYTIQRSVSGNNLYIEDGGGLAQPSLLHPGARETSFKGSTSTIDQEYNSTPSPSDSAVGDLETVLKEKDNEIIYLRETMEQNEQVIFKVYEEKERVWERELRKIKGLYENRLKANQQKASKMEQALMNQTLQVQNEKRKLETELEDVQKAKSELIQEAQSLESELFTLRKSLDLEGISLDAKSEESFSKHVTSKFHELTQLKEQIAEIKRLMEVRHTEVDDLKAENKQMQDEIINLQSLLDLDNEECKLKEIAIQKEVIIDRDKTIERIQRSLKDADVNNKILKDEVDKYKENFEVEKANWLDEKEKVIRYQKQLQLNYVQMYKRNKTLESEVDQLKKSLAESSQKPTVSTSTKSKLFSKFSKFHESQC